MTDESGIRVTNLLAKANDGDRTAKERLFGLIEDEMRMIAQKQMRNERPDHSLQVTVLVDDTLLQLVGEQIDVSWQNRKHFYRAAARSMRRMLIDHERKRRAQRRGGGEYKRAEIGPDELGGAANQLDLLALDEALTKMAEVDPRQSQIVELHHFGGCSLVEVAKIMDLSPSTIRNEWNMAKAWLHRELSSD